MAQNTVKQGIETFDVYAVTDINKVNGQEAFSVVIARCQRNAEKKIKWQFKRCVVTSNEIIKSINNGAKWVNAKISANNKVVGSAASFKRFTASPNKPIVILSQITNGEVNGNRIIGYTVVDHNGTARQVSKKALLEMAVGVAKKGGIPIQNAIVVTQDATKSPMIKSYPNHPFIDECMPQKKNKNVVAVPRNDTKQAEKRLSDAEHKFNKQQLKELKIGKDKGVKYQLYAKCELSPQQMAAIRYGLEKGIDPNRMRALVNPDFKPEIIKMYITSLKHGHDIRTYLNPKYSAAQVAELSIAYAYGLDLSRMSDPKLSCGDMAEIREALLDKTWKEQKVTDIKHLR